MNILSWLLLLLIPFILLLFTKRGSAKIYYIKIIALAFKKHQAVSPETAKRLEELGLKRYSFEGNPFINMLFGSMFRGDDAKQDALESMIRDRIVVILPDGRVYLSESKLKSAGFSLD